MKLIVLSFFLSFSINSFAVLSKPNNQRSKQCDAFNKNYSSFFFKNGLFSNSLKPFVSDPPFLNAALTIVLESPLITNSIWNDMQELAKTPLTEDNLKYFSDNRIAYKSKNDCGAKELQGLFFRLIELSKLPTSHLLPKEVRNLWKEYLAFLLSEKITASGYVNVGRIYNQLVGAKTIDRADGLKDHDQIISGIESKLAAQNNVNADSTVQNMKPEELMNFEKSNQIDLRNDLEMESIYRKNVLAMYNKK